MKICNNCQTQNNDTAAFCTGCGAALNTYQPAMNAVVINQKPKKQMSGCLVAFITVAIILVSGFFLLLLIGLAFGGSGNTPKEPDTVVTDQEPNTPAEEPSTPVTDQEPNTPTKEPDTPVTDQEPDTPAEEDKKPAKTYYAVGDTTTLGQWEITITDARIVPSFPGDYGTYSPEEDASKFVHIFLTITNKGDKSETFLKTFPVGKEVRAKILSNNYEFALSNFITYSKDLHNTTLNPLNSKSGELAAAIPNVIADGEDELILRFSFGADAVEYKIR